MITRSAFTLQIFIVTYFLLCHTNIIAQSKLYKPVNFVTREGEHKKGFTAEYTNKRNPDEFIIFKNENGSGDTLSLTPLNTSLVEIIDYEFYKSARVTLYNNLLNLDQTTEGALEPSEIQTIFLRRLIKGNRLSLYEFKTDKKDHFFIEDSAGNMETLRYLKYFGQQQQQTGIIEKNIYRDQLSLYIKDRPELFDYLSKTRFKSNDLINFVQRINTRSVIEENVSKELKKKIFFLFCSAGMVNVKATYLGLSNNVKMIDLKSAIEPYFAAGGEFVYGKKSDFFSDFTIGIYPFSGKGNYTFTDVYGKEITNTYELAYVAEAIGATINYKVINSPITKLSVGIGFNLVLSSYSKNNYTTTNTNPNGTIVILDQENLNKSGAQYFAQMQYFLGKRGAIQFMYAPKQDFTTYSKANLSQSQLTILFKYILGKIR
ncbi:MAG: hypothetical protein ABIN97_11940 [Ginsengibacter sp.]